jgi:hypothetical protein
MAKIARMARFAIRRAGREGRPDGARVVDGSFCQIGDGKDCHDGKICHPAGGPQKATGPQPSGCRPVCLSVVSRNQGPEPGPGSPARPLAEGGADSKLGSFLDAGSGSLLLT